MAKLQLLWVYLVVLSLVPLDQIALDRDYWVRNTSDGDTQVTIEQQPTIRAMDTHSPSRLGYDCIASDMIEGHDRSHWI